jgi:hypothetical protein
MVDLAIGLLDELRKFENPTSKATSTRGMLRGVRRDLEDMKSPCELRRREASPGSYGPHGVTFAVPH